MSASRPVVLVLAPVLVLAALALPARADEADDLANPQKAAKKFEEATRKAPEDAASWFNLGLAYYKLERWDDSVGALTKATTLNAENGRAFYWLGKSLAKAGKGTESVTAYERAIELGVVEAKSDIAQAYFAAGRWDDAIAAYKEAVKTAEKKGPLYNQIGAAYLKKGDAESAIKWFERNIEEAPDSPTTYYNLGQMYRKAAQESGEPAMWSKSADTLVKAAQMDPKNTTAMFLAGEALIMAGRQADGLTWIDKYLAADPGGKKSGATVYEFAQGYKKDLSK